MMVVAGRKLTKPSEQMAYSHVRLEMCVHSVNGDANWS